MTFNWSKKPFLFAALYAAVVVALFLLIGIDFSLPWQPISVVGIAVAFYLGFKNNSSYDRTWEARKIWSAITSHSRTFATAVITMADSGDAEKNNVIHRRIIYRHIAWLTALRYQLRLSKQWEHQTDRLTGLYIPTICESYFDSMDLEIGSLLDSRERARYKAQSNMAAQILATQAKELKEMHDAQFMNDYMHIRLHSIIGNLYDEQGKCERIKNFPFPRQYASTALWLTFVFCALLPFGLLDIFSANNVYRAWLTVPFTALIAWVFFLMEKIGDYSENPFEGTYNDVPITTISRSIEIDIREMIEDANVPAPVMEENGFLM